MANTKREWKVERPYSEGDKRMTQQTNGTLELKYSEETFREMYEALQAMLEGNELDPKNPNRVWVRVMPTSEAILEAFQALAKAKGRNDNLP